MVGKEECSLVAGRNVHGFEGNDAVRYTGASHNSAVPDPWPVVVELAAANSGEVENRDFGLPEAVENP